MSNHLHLIANVEDGFKLSDIVRDFKKYTAKKIISQIQEEPESRREWLLSWMEFRGKGLKRIMTYKFWEDSNHAIELTDHHIFEQKLN
jgi:REP element-mobilizing transposase RayT